VNFEFEVVVADDCSSDGSVAVIESFRSRFGDRLRLLQTDVNLGVTRNFRRALSACRGRYVAMCEGDDYRRGRHKLQLQVDFLEASGLRSLFSRRLRDRTTFL
jgi:glycosyltransferase involved in cell wall biosynthesis